MATKRLQKVRSMVKIGGGRNFYFDDRFVKGIRTPASPSWCSMGPAHARPVQWAPPAPFTESRTNTLIQSIAPFFGYNWPSIACIEDFGGAREAARTVPVAVIVYPSTRF